MNRPLFLICGAVLLLAAVPFYSCKRVDPAVLNVELLPVPDNPLVRQSATSTRTVGGIGPDPLIVGGLIVAALVIAATGLWRRRSRTP